MHREILYRYKLETIEIEAKDLIGLRKHVQTKNYEIKILTGTLINGLEEALFSF